MRAALVLVLLAGCPGSGGGGDDYIPPGGFEPGGCHMDSDCAPDVCARDGECLPPDQVHAIRVTWTVDGQPASDAACANSPDLWVQFDGDFQGDGVGFEPVPCKAGVFSVDKLPSRFGFVSIGRADGSDLADGQLDGDGHVTFDLQL